MKWQENNFFECMVMIKNFIDKNYIYVFFLPLFFLLHGLNENYGIIPVKVIMQLLMVYISITVFVVVLSLFLLKNSTRATAFSFYILSVFFLFGAMHDFLKSTISNSFFVSY